MKKTLISIFICSVVIFSQSNFLHAEFQFGKTIPQKTITLDGNSNDWSGIEPFISDPPWDRGCEDVDFKSVYLAQDETYLYCRLDLYDGGFPVYTEIDVYHRVFIEFNQQTPPSNHIEGDLRIKLDDPGTQIEQYNGDSFEDILTGTEYGAFGDVAEVKIPISLFGVGQFMYIEIQIKNGCDTGYCDIVMLPDWLRPDTDSDGIFDFWDKCPSTPPNSYVDNNGCAGSSTSKVVVVPLF